MVTLVNPKLQYCRVHLPAYIRGDASPAVRNRVARYLEECPNCYAEYQRQRDLQYDLKTDLGVLGRTSQTQTDRLWDGIQESLRTTPVTKNILSLSNGAKTAIFVLLLLVTVMTVSASVNLNVQDPIPQQPSPESEPIEVTPSVATVLGSNGRTSIDIRASTTKTSFLQSVALQNTPDAKK